MVKPKRSPLDQRRRRDDEEMSTMSLKEVDPVQVLHQTAEPGGWQSPVDLPLILDVLHRGSRGIGA